MTKKSPSQQHVLFQGSLHIIQYLVHPLLENVLIFSANSECFFSVSVLVVYCHVTNYYNFSNLKKYTFISSNSVSQKCGKSQLNPIFKVSQGSHQGLVKINSCLGILEYNLPSNRFRFVSRIQFLVCESDVSVYLLAVGKGLFSDSKGCLASF